MVEYSSQLDLIFSSLSDPIRRDILNRVAQKERSVGELVTNYSVSFAAISKHLKVLEKAKLVYKRKEGKKQIVTLAPGALKGADQYLEQCRRNWQGSFNKLETLLEAKE